MKKILAIALIALFTIASVFAQAASETQPSETKIVVGATPEPHAALLALVVDDLASQGITLEVKEFTDYVTPNDAVEYGEIDANYFQHIPYLESFNTEHGYHLVNAGGIHVEPIALYSSKYYSLYDIPNGAVVAIPNDPTNEGRALLLLQSAGLVATRDGLFVEGADSPYVNVIAVKAGNENNPAVKALVEALKSDKVKAYVAEHYKNGEVVLVD